MIKKIQKKIDTQICTSPRERGAIAIKGVLCGRKLEILYKEPISAKERVANFARASFITILTLGVGLFSESIRDLWESTLTGFGKKRIWTTIHRTKATELGAFVDVLEPDLTQKKITIGFKKNREFLQDLVDQKIEFLNLTSHEDIRDVIAKKPQYIAFTDPHDLRFEELAKIAITKEPSLIMRVDESDKNTYEHLSYTAIETEMKKPNNGDAFLIYLDLPDWVKTPGTQVSTLYKKIIQNKSTEPIV